MSPAPSPANSENDLSKIDSNTLKKDRKSRKNTKKNKNRDSASTDEKSALSPIPTSLDVTPDDTKIDKSGSLNRNSGM